MRERINAYAEYMNLYRRAHQQERFRYESARMYVCVSVSGIEHLQQ